jgi:hypothetical protein
MLKRYGEKAPEQSAARADELAADGDHDGASTWRRITSAGRAACEQYTARAGALNWVATSNRREVIASSESVLLLPKFRCIAS